MSNNCFTIGGTNLGIASAVSTKCNGDMYNKCNYNHLPVQVISMSALTPSEKKVISDNINRPILRSVAKQPPMQKVTYPGVL